MTFTSHRTAGPRARRNKLRKLLYSCFALVVAGTCLFVYDAAPVSAAAQSATIVRRDRRPDRERPNAAQGQGDSPSPGSTTQPSRPRLVRH